LCVVSFFITIIIIIITIIIIIIIIIITIIISGLRFCRVISFCIFIFLVQ